MGANISHCITMQCAAMSTSIHLPVVCMYDLCGFHASRLVIRVDYVAKQSGGRGHLENRHVHVNVSFPHPHSHTRITPAHTQHTYTHAPYTHTHIHTYTHARAITHTHKMYTHMHTHRHNTHTILTQAQSRGWTCDWHTHTVEVLGKRSAHILCNS